MKRNEKLILSVILLIIVMTFGACSSGFALTNGVSALQTPPSESNGSGQDDPAGADAPDGSADRQGATSDGSEGGPVGSLTEVDSEMRRQFDAIRTTKSMH